MDFTAQVAAYFPVGTTVTVYPLSNWPFHALSPSGAAVGSSADSDTVSAASEVAFTGLDADTAYVMEGTVDTVHRYVNFLTGPAPAAASGAVAPTIADDVYTSATDDANADSLIETATGSPPVDGVLYWDSASAAFLIRRESDGKWISVGGAALF